MTQGLGVFQYHLTVFWQRSLFVLDRFMDIIPARCQTLATFFSGKTHKTEKMILK